MPWGYVAAAVVGAVSASDSSRKANHAQKDASKRATEEQRRQLESGKAEVAPFKEAGMSALPGLMQAANDPVTPFSYRDQNKYLNDYFNSAEYGILNKQANDQILRSASATGGIRNGNTNASLMDVAPTLGIDALNRVNQQDVNSYSINQGALADRYNRLYGLANMGANAASGNQNAGMQFGTQAGANALNAGNAQAAGYLRDGQAMQGLASDLGSAYAGYKMGYFNQPQQASAGTGVTQNGYTGAAYQNWVAQQSGKP